MKTLLKVCALTIGLAAGACTARAEEPAPAQPAAKAPAAGVSVEAKTCKTIAQHECTDATDSFATGDTILTWNKVTGLAGGKLHHVYFQGDKQVSDITLEVTRSPYRTYSRKKLPDAPQGDWRVEIRDDGGAVLQTLKFSVK
jgi:hypothetical protein